MHPLLAFTVLNASLPIMMNLYEVKYREQDKQKAFPNQPLNLNLPVEEIFDFIIVGAGTAGCVVGRRLADANFTVLMLEAGGNPPPLQSVPSFSQTTKWIPSIHHFYESTVQTNAGLSNGGILKSSSAKMMGGSSSHNSGQFERGSPFDYDNFAKITRDESWKYKNVLQYFMKLENYSGIWPLNDQHGQGGLVHIMSPNKTFREEIWFDAGQELGYHTIDSNGPQKVGFCSADYTWKNGKRVSTYTAYIEPIEEHAKNLNVRRYSTVTEILFEGKKAVGVLYERHGVPMAAFASKEIILSAGAYKSPVILIRSGIGPLDQLILAKKEPIAILPVGQNMQEHVSVVMPLIVVDDETVFKYDDLKFRDFDTFLKTGDGPLNFDNMDEAFIVSSRERNKNWPDIQIYFRQSDDPKNRKRFLCISNLNRPRSRGKLTINSTAQTLDDLLLPILNYNFFSDPTDVDVIVEGMEFCEKIVLNTTSFKNINARFQNTKFEQCQSHGNFTGRDFKRCYVRQFSYANFHVVSTNPMGRGSDPKAVVDSKFKVLGGVQNLRVVDGSVMPTLTNANTMAPIIMMAEKASDDLLTMWKNSIPAE